MSPSCSSCHIVHRNRMELSHYDHALFDTLFTHSLYQLLIPIFIRKEIQLMSAVFHSIRVFIQHRKQSIRSRGLMSHRRVDEHTFSNKIIYIVFKKMEPVCWECIELWCYPLKCSVIFISYLSIKDPSCCYCYIWIKTFYCWLF